MKQINDLKAFETLMESPSQSKHFDSGSDGILPECRSCKFHRPFQSDKTCVYDFCPYTKTPLSTLAHSKARENGR